MKIMLIILVLISVLYYIFTSKLEKKEVMIYKFMLVLTISFPLIITLLIDYLIQLFS